MNMFEVFIVVFIIGLFIMGFACVGIENNRIHEENKRRRKEKIKKKR